MTDVRRSWFEEWLDIRDRTIPLVAAEKVFLSFC